MSAQIEDMLRDLPAIASSADCKTALARYIIEFAQRGDFEGDNVSLGVSPSYDLT